MTKQVQKKNQAWQIIYAMGMDNNNTKRWIHVKRKKDEWSLWSLILIANLKI